jgi:hypothetical protein
MKSNSEIILGMHQALLGNISSNFRMICVNWDEDSLRLRIYTEKEPNNEDIELASVILTEFEIHVKFIKYEEEITYSPLPLNKLDALKLVLYARQEL